MIVIFHLKSQFITDGTQINFSPQKFRVTTIGISSILPCLGW